MANNIKMNVGVNGRVFGVEGPDGAAQVGIRHARNLHARPGVDCRLYGHPDVQQWFDDRPKIRSTGFHWNSQVYGTLWERTFLPALTANDDLDVLFCPNANAPPAQLGAHSTVVMIHHVAASQGHSPLQRAYRGTMIPLGVRNVDAVVTVSEFSKQKIVETLSVNPGDVHVIYNGVDEIFFDTTAGEPIDLPEEYIFFVGSADERKNLDSLIKAYNELETDAELVVAGPQNSIAYGREHINRDDIINLGYVSQAELRYAYEHAALFAYPSKYEGFGLPPLEAAACGTPVVTSNVSAIPEIMADAAEFVDPFNVDSIKRGLEIIHDSSRLAQLSQSGRKRADKFTWRESTDRLLDVFDGVVEG